MKKGIIALLLLSATAMPAFAADPVLSALYNVTVNYVRRRLPPASA